jgi:hypothetical protein
MAYKLPINFQMVWEFILKPVCLAALSVLFGWTVWEILKKITDFPDLVTIPLSSVAAYYLGKHLIRSYYSAKP